MAVKPGMKRLKEFEHLPQLSEKAREALDIPEEAEVVNITNHWEQGGPIVISYVKRVSDEERQHNRRKLQDAIDGAFDAIIERCQNDMEYYTALKARLERTT